MPTSNRHRSIPQVPVDTPRNLQHLLRSLREAVQVLSDSKRGDKLDRAVTFRDLKNEGFLSSLGQSLPTSSSPVGGEGDLVGQEQIESPTVPTGVEGVAGFDFALITWNLPTYGGHSHTEIYRQTVSADPEQVIDYGSAVLIGSVVGNVFSDAVDAGSEHYYWLRHVNKADPPEKSAIHDVAGLRLSTADSYQSLIDDATTDVLNGLSFWQSDFDDALSILDEQSLRLVLESDGTVQLLDSRIESVETNASAYYDQTVQTVANTVGSATTRIEKLEASTFRRDGDGKLLLDAEGQPLLSSAFIDSVDAAVATVDGQLMAAIGDSITITNSEDVSYTLSQIMSMTLDNEGNYSSQWGVKQSVGDLQYGVGFVSYTEPDGTYRTAFHVAAETFSVFDPALGTEIFPFIVRNGKVLIKEALIDIAAITTLIADRIVTAELFAGKRIVSPKITGGEITGSTLDINGKTTISSAGLLRAINAVVEGRIVANEGELNNVTINDTCTVEGTVYADNIEGDVLDRSVIVVGEEFTVGASSDYTLVQGDIVPGRIGPKSDRFLSISGIALDHQGGGGSTSNFDVALYVNGVEAQRFNSRNVEEEGSVTVSMGALIPKGTTTNHFRVVLETDVNDNILVQQSAILVDVVKAGSTIQNVSALHSGPTAPAGSVGGGGVYINNG